MAPRGARARRSAGTVGLMALALLTAMCGEEDAGKTRQRRAKSDDTGAAGDANGRLGVAGEPATANGASGSGGTASGTAEGSSGAADAGDGGQTGRPRSSGGTAGRDRGGRAGSAARDGTAGGEAGGSGAGDGSPVDTVPGDGGRGGAGASGGVGGTATAGSGGTGANAGAGGTVAAGSGGTGSSCIPPSCCSPDMPHCETSGCNPTGDGYCCNDTEHYTESCYDSGETQEYICLNECTGRSFGTGSCASCVGADDPPCDFESEWAASCSADAPIYCSNLAAGYRLKCLKTPGAAGTPVPHIDVECTCDPG